MPKFVTHNISITKEGKNIEIVSKENFDSFNLDILGLGAINTESQTINALSVMFDLEGFTNFCKQIDPQLAVPEYLSSFLNWIFKEVKLQLIQKRHPEGYETWADLPFLSKFLGDGLLFLWDTQNKTDIEIQNVVVSMYEICMRYRTHFLPGILKDIITPPTKLRCGIARGSIYSVGNGNDFVGPCINMSARLQKLSSLSFAFSRRGINPTKFSENYASKFIVKKVDVRGIGNEELACILQTEFDLLSDVDKEVFLD